MRGVPIWSVAVLVGIIMPCDVFAAASRSAVASVCEVGTTSTSMPLLEAGSSNLSSSRRTIEIDEELPSVPGRETRWIDAPGLVVLTSVMSYRSGTRTEYEATSERLASEDVERLVEDLTAALALLTDNTFTRFASVSVESANPGDLVNVKRPGHIVVGRYRGVRDQLKTIGVGGRFRSGPSIKAGTVLLDEDYDRTSDRRALLRTHELGHALGYDHVDSRPSIMNPRIGSDVTDYDRQAARVAFRQFGVPPACPAS